nr:cation transporter [Acidihalobacter aeolianus]
MPGVSGVKPNLDRKTVTVTYDPRKTDVAALTCVTTDAGYPSHPLG